MKKVIRLTESDLIRLVRRVVKEQRTLPTDVKPQTNKRAGSAYTDAYTDAYTTMGPKYDLIQQPFYNYVQTRWGHEEDPYASTDIDFDQNGNFKLCDGPCKAMIPGTDENTIIWDYKKGMVSGLKSFGIDPKPISIKSNFGQMKQWFDNTYGRDSQKTPSNREGCSY